MFAPPPYSLLEQGPPAGGASEETDAASLALIAELWNEDVQQELYLAAAEQMQLAIAFADSRPRVAGAESAPAPETEAPSETDRMRALRLALDSGRSNLSQDTVEAMERGQAQLLGDAALARQISLSFAAGERRSRIDREMAQRLQRTDDEGREDIDAVQMRDVDAVLGEQRVRELMVRSERLTTRD